MDGFDPLSLDVFSGQIGKDTMLESLVMIVSKSLWISWVSFYRIGEFLL